jgi:hypothetical protein
MRDAIQTRQVGSRSLVGHRAVRRELVTAQAMRDAIQTRQVGSRLHASVTVGSQAGTLVGHRPSAASS